jgi:hypothetical protein
MAEYTITDRYGRVVPVTRIPARGKAKKLFKSGRPYDGTDSPFDRFSSSNGTKDKITSF